MSPIIVIPPSPIVYLDNSALGRLTDADPRLAAEAALVAAIIATCLTGRLRLLISEILALEVRRARSAAVRATSRAVLDAAWAGVRLEPTREAARRLEAIGFRPADALHLAAAYTGGAAYAVSCDAHWLRRADHGATLLGPGPEIVSPAECVRREGVRWVLQPGDRDEIAALPWAIQRRVQELLLRTFSPGVNAIIVSRLGVALVPTEDWLPEIEDQLNTGDVDDAVATLRQWASEPPPSDV